MGPRQRRFIILAILAVFYLVAYKLRLSDRLFK